MGAWLGQLLWLLVPRWWWVRRWWLLELLWRSQGLPLLLQALLWWLLARLWLVQQCWLLAALKWLYLQQAGGWRLSDFPVLHQRGTQEA